MATETLRQRDQRQLKQRALARQQARQAQLAVCSAPPGHPFYGNQHTEGSGSATDVSKSAKEASRKAAAGVNKLGTGVTSDQHHLAAAKAHKTAGEARRKAAEETNKAAADAYTRGDTTEGNRLAKEVDEHRQAAAEHDLAESHHHLRSDDPEGTDKGAMAKGYYDAKSTSPIDSNVMERALGEDKGPTKHGGSGYRYSKLGAAMDLVGRRKR